MTTHYETLGVKKSAKHEEIRKAYKKKAMKHHPDRKGGDSDKFTEINEAYQVLSVPSERAYYDKTGKAKRKVNEADEVEAYFMGAFASLIDKFKSDDIDCLDLVGKMNEMFDLARKRDDKLMAEVKDVLAKNKKIVKRVKHKKKENLMCMVARQNIQQCNVKIEEIKKVLLLGKKAKKHLKDYGFDFEKATEVHKGPSDGFTSFNSMADVEAMFFGRKR